MRNKSQQLNSLELFDDKVTFDDLEVLSEGASWRPVNLIVFESCDLAWSGDHKWDVLVIRKYNVWLALLLLGVLNFYRRFRFVSDPNNRKPLKRWWHEAKYARKLNYLSSLLLGARRCQGKFVYSICFRGDHTLSEIILTYHKKCWPDPGESRCFSFSLLSMTVAVSAGVAFGGLSDKFSKNSWGSGSYWCISQWSLI